MDRVNKKVILDAEARNKVLEGSRAVYEAVSQAFGVTSGNVLIEKEWGKPILTHDGITIAREVYLQDPDTNAAAQLLIEASQKTNDIAGDGTSATVILGYEIIKKAQQRIASGMDAMSIKRGIIKASEKAKELIESLSKEVSTDEELKNVATVSAGDESIGTLIAETVKEVGDDGGINIEEYQGVGIEQEIVDGYYFDKGYISPQMVTDSSGIVNYSDCLIMVTEKKLSTVGDIVPLLKIVVDINEQKPGGRILLIGDVAGDALNMLIINSRQTGAVSSVAVLPPIYGDQQTLSLEDIAILTGGKLIRNGESMDNLTKEHLGKADKVTITSDSTTIIGGQGDKEVIKNRIKEIKDILKTEKNEFRVERMRSRVSKLTGKVGLIRVGGATETGMKEIKRRVDNAVNATQAAKEEGIVIGGGICLVHVGHRLMDQTPEELMGTDEYEGWRVVCEALNAPFLKLMENAGLDGSYNLRQIKEVNSLNMGYDVRNPTDEPIDLAERGIIDPIKVIKMVVENALSVAGNAITTNCIMTLIPKENNA
jgi:chaperonin GroEL